MIVSYLATSSLSSPNILVRSTKTPPDTWMVVKPSSSLHKSLASKQKIMDVVDIEDLEPISDMISTVFGSLERTDHNHMHFEFNSGVMEGEIERRGLSRGRSSFVFHSRDSIRRHSRINTNTLLEKVFHQLILYQRGKTIILWRRRNECALRYRINDANERVTGYS